MLIQEETEDGRRIARLAEGWTRLRASSPLDLFVLFELVTIQDELPSGRWPTPDGGYRYEFRLADGPLLLAYHWHPVGVSPVTTPHLHLGGALQGINLAEAHLPTGPVVLPDVLRFAIVDLGVDPLRDDWREVLAAR